MEATIKKWGNSYAIRLTKRDLERLHLKEGETVDVQIMKAAAPIDLSGLPVFHDGGDAAQHHDRYLYGP